MVSAISTSVDRRWLHSTVFFLRISSELLFYCRSRSIDVARGHYGAVPFHEAGLRVVPVAPRRPLPRPVLRPRIRALVSLQASACPRPRDLPSAPRRVPLSPKFSPRPLGFSCRVNHFLSIPLCLYFLILTCLLLG